jgi:hypothetical protein
MTFRSDLDEEAPLDPRLLRIQQRLRRMMIIGISTLGIGVLAVLIAIIYRFYIKDSSGPIIIPEVPVAAEPQAPITGEITAEAVGLGPDAELIQQTLDGDRLMLIYREGTNRITIIVDTDTMTVVGRLVDATGAP